MGFQETFQSGRSRRMQIRRTYAMREFVPGTRAVQRERCSSAVLGFSNQSPASCLLRERPHTALSDAMTAGLEPNDPYRLINGSVWVYRPSLSTGWTNLEHKMTQLAVFHGSRSVQHGQFSVACRSWSILSALSPHVRWLYSVRYKPSRT